MGSAPGAAPSVCRSGFLHDGFKLAVGHPRADGRAGRCRLDTAHYGASCQPRDAIAAGQRGIRAEQIELAGQHPQALSRFLPAMGQAGRQPVGLRRKALLLAADELARGRHLAGRQAGPARGQGHRGRLGESVREVIELLLKLPDQFLSYQ